MIIETLYEDDNYLIVNKPEGLVVHATVDKNRENLFDILKKSRPNSYLGLHHRLDRDTSGAMLFTKNESVNDFISEGFAKHTIVKKYWAIVHGEWEIKGRLEDFLKKEKVKNKEIMIGVLKGGQKAISEVQTLKASDGLSLIEFTLKTGRMHQIRVQSQIRKHPLVGDLLYGNSSLDNKINANRLLLHSRSLEFHYDDKIITAIAPVSLDFQNWIDKIK